MPTVVSHSFVSLVFGNIFRRISSFPCEIDSFKFWSLSIACSILPDADVIPMYFGIPYAHMFGHRGFSHSILFVFVMAFIATSIGFPEVKRNSKQWWWLLSFLLFAGLSHILSDALTTGGLGIGFFMPFDSTRYFFSFRPIRVSPFSLLRLFDSEGQKILISEFICIWVPLLILLLIVRITRYPKKPVS